MKDLIKRLFREITISGYNKSNLTFFKRKNNFTYIINIQPSRNNIKGEERFTINVGVFCPEIHQLVWEKVSKIPAETECTFRTRVNYFLNSKKDFWLELSNDNEVFYKTQNFITSLIEEKINPFFDFVIDYNALRKIMLDWEGSDSQYPLFKIQLAVIDFLCNDQGKAFEALQKISVDKVWGEKAIKVISNLQKYVPQDYKYRG